jgi:glycosyltransferase involved in cell wall biosynthesis
MKIAQIAPVWEAVPPHTYGGTELVIQLLVEELTRMGHSVVLFASADSQVECQNSLLELVPTVDRPLRSQGISFYNGIYHELEALEIILKRVSWGDIDVVHNHMGFQALPFASQMPAPMVTTLHGAFGSNAPMDEMLDRYRHLPYVSISDYQRRPGPALNYAATIYHGLNLTRYQPAFEPSNKDYLAFLGRFSPEKGPHHAIRLARETGWPLLMAGKVDTYDQAYFEQVIAPELDGRQIVYIGEVNLPQKVKLLSNAAATICPVTWPEPFGLVITESMACGTPVLALKNGSIPELVVHGKTGFIADTLEALIDTVPQIPELSRQGCRLHVETHFSARRMAEAHVAVYQQLIAERSATTGLLPVRPKARLSGHPAENLPAAVAAGATLLGTGSVSSPPALQNGATRQTTRNQAPERCC